MCKDGPPRTNSFWSSRSGTADVQSGAPNSSVFVQAMIRCRSSSTSESATSAILRGRRAGSCSRHRRSRSATASGARGSPRLRGPSARWAVGTSPVAEPVVRSTPPVNICRTDTARL
ncbi:hypothetical protein TK78_01955 [Streptomyces sp. Tue 6075]|nr:hypothetical protein TK78_01955 [Streptomyces sp. Tue 6075]